MDNPVAGEAEPGQALMGEFVKLYDTTGDLSPGESWERELVGLGFGGNLNLTTQARAYREVDGWKFFLLLTPWRLARILIPPQGHEGLPGWLALADPRQCSALGPLVTVQINQSLRKAHVQFHPLLGLHLLEPLVLNMVGYRDNDAVFTAHDRVIETRDRIMAQTGRSCSTQSEISRRELFAPFRKIGKLG